MKKSLFKNCTISTGIGNNTKIVDILVVDEKFDKIESNQIPDTNTQVIDLQNQLIIPGGIDSHVHFNTPGFEDRETFKKGSAFAASGGITTVIDMPCTSLPPVTSLKNLENKLNIISGQSYTDFALWGGVSGNSFHDTDWKESMAQLWDNGIVGFKTYSLSGMDTFTHLLPEELKEVMKEAGKIGALIGHHAEAAEIIIPLTQKYKSTRNNSAEGYAQSRPVIAETTAVRRMIEYCKQYNTPTHIVHISSGETVKMIKESKQLNIDISGETCPHYLAFNVNFLLKMGSILKTAPVIKSQNDSNELWLGLKNDILAFITSDHAPCPAKQKETGSFWTDYGGISGTGTILPFLFSEGYMKNKITLSQLINLTSVNPAKRFGLFPGKGSITPGTDADFVCIDKNSDFIVKADEFLSQGKLSPFDNWTFKGKITSVFLRGKQIFSFKNGILNNNIGQFIKRN